MGRRQGKAQRICDLRLNGRLMSPGWHLQVIVPGLQSLITLIRCNTNTQYEKLEAVLGIAIHMIRGEEVEGYVVIFGGWMRKLGEERQKMWACVLGKESADRPPFPRTSSNDRQMHPDKYPSQNLNSRFQREGIYFCLLPVPLAWSHL